MEIARVTARQILGRRRTLLLALLAAIPVLLALVFRLAGPTSPRALDGFAQSVFVAMIVTLLLPLVALVFGTAAFGTDIEDGTVVYLLAKPVPRRRIVLAKWLVAGAASLVLVTGATLAAGLLGLAGTPDGVETTVGFAVGVAVGAVVYAGVFIALSLVTGRALIGGLLYVLVWEGALADLFSGIRFLSIRQYVLGIADAAGAGGRVGGDTLELATAVVLATVVVIGAFVIAVRRLSAFEIPQAD
ncbi:MAG: ABC transporter permease [Chloroflexi bacterium]|nr:ABC transporter permease [Chloroflexota bacterium]